MESEIEYNPTQTLSPQHSPQHSPSITPNSHVIAARDPVIALNEDHHKCIIKLINSIIAKSPHLEELNYDSIVFVRLVSVISLIETTLCSKYQVMLRRNSTADESINIIKNWLKQYYRESFVDTLCQNMNANGMTSTDVVNATDNGVIEDSNNDIPLMSLMILSIAHKLRISLPRINAYFDPDWQTLDHFDETLHQITNCDKLLELVQNELCLKRKQLEVTRSKVSQLQSTLNSKLLQANKEKRTKLDYHSNLFAEYEDESDFKNIVFADDSGEEMVSDEVSNGSFAYVDHSSDDDYVPGKKIARLSSGSISRTPVPKKSYYKKSYRGRGRPPKSLSAHALIPISVTPPNPTPHRGRGRPPKNRSIEKEDIESDSVVKEKSITMRSSDTSSNVGDYECDTCGKRFAKEYRLTRHTFTHKGHKQFQCDWQDCNESFDLKWKLSEHRQEHNIDGEDDDAYGNNQIFECEWADCGDSFQSKRELTIHEHEQHANRSTSKYSCDWPQCREIFENKIDWRKHVKTHGKIVPTECGFPGCHKSFYKLESLENHRKIHETFSLNDLS